MQKQKIKLMYIATYASIFVTVFLLLIKLWAWFQTNSISIQASLLDSLLDSLSSLVNFFALRQALRPPDDEHRFGHGKIEALTTQLQAIFIGISGLWIIYEGINSIINPRTLHNAAIGINVIAITIFLSLIMIFFQKYVIEKTNSIIIKADRLHFKGDLLLNIAVLTTLLLHNYTTWAYFDPICGLLIGGYICYSSWQIAIESINILIDREISNVEKNKIKQIVISHKDVYGMHDFKTRSAGSKKFVQLHVEMQADISLQKAHDIVQEIFDSISTQFPEMDIIIHQDIYQP